MAGVTYSTRLSVIWILVPVLWDSLTSSLNLALERFFRFSWRTAAKNSSSSKMMLRCYVNDKHRSLLCQKADNEACLL